MKSNKKKSINEYQVPITKYICEIKTAIGMSITNYLINSIIYALCTIKETIKRRVLGCF